MKVAVIMGSTSDLPVMQDAVDILKLMEIDHEVKIVSAHRTPDFMYDYAKHAKENGIDIIIAGAGGAAHLPGMVAALCQLPVIGVPVKSRTLNGWDSLLSIVQMPKGVPVATVAINASANAALLATSMIALTDKEVDERLINYRKEQTEAVLNND